MRMCVKDHWNIGQVGCFVDKPHGTTRLPGPLSTFRDTPVNLGTQDTKYLTTLPSHVVGTYVYLTGACYLSDFWGYIFTNVARSFCTLILIQLHYGVVLRSP